MPVSMAALGRIRQGLGVDEGKRCCSQDAVQPGLPRLQRMAGVDRAWAVLRKNGAGASRDDLDDRVRVVRWLGPWRFALREMQGRFLDSIGSLKGTKLVMGTGIIPSLVALECSYHADWGLGKIIVPCGMRPWTAVGIVPSIFRRCLLHYC
jgi:hypothetical protein